MGGEAAFDGSHEDTKIVRNGHGRRDIFVSSCEAIELTRGFAAKCFLLTPLREMLRSFSPSRSTGYTCD
jgi:hypothetical protein